MNFTGLRLDTCTSLDSETNVLHRFVELLQQHEPEEGECGEQRLE